MKDKKHFLDHHRHDSSAATAVSYPSSSSPPIYPALHPNHPPPHHFSRSPIPIPTVELPRRRRRGRPPGSKNKPKPKPNPKPPSSSLASASLNPSGGPLPPPSMSTLLLQIDPNNDVVDSITRFCRSKLVSISILSASGALSHFTLRPPSSPPSNLAFCGMFEILSISATIISESASPSESGSNPSLFYLPSWFTVTVSGPQGQVVGGAVGGPLIAAGPVFVVAASFDKPTYHRLPEMNDHEDCNEKRQTTGVAGIGGGGGGIFARNLGGSDAVWDPAVARTRY